MPVMWDMNDLCMKQAFIIILILSIVLRFGVELSLSRKASKAPKREGPEAEGAAEEHGREKRRGASTLNFPLHTHQKAALSTEDEHSANLIPRSTEHNRRSICNRYCD